MEISVENRNFEMYLKNAGWGFYNKIILSMTCICSLINSITFVSFPLSLALSSCEPLSIPKPFILKIFATFYFGSAFGSIIMASLCDRYGRKKYLIYGLICTFMSTFASAFAYSLYIINIAAIFLGVGLETSRLTSKLLLGELLPKERRGFYLVLYDAIGIFGYVLATVLVILLETPTVLGGKNHPHSLSSWRIILAVCGGMNLVLACACALLEESPRYFLHMNRNYLAFLILKQTYAINKSSFADYFEVTEEEMKGLIKGYNMNYIEPMSILDTFTKLCWRWWMAMKLMLSSRFRNITVVLVLMKTFVIIFGCFQLNTILSKNLTSKIAGQSENKITGLNFVYPVYDVVTYRNHMFDKENMKRNMCSAHRENRIYYENILLFTSTMLPGILLCMLAVDTLGRKPILFSGFLISTCCFLLFDYLRLNLFKLLCCCLIAFAFPAIRSTISLIGIESYPTAIRGNAWGLTSFLGNFLSLFIVVFAIVDMKELELIPSDP
ncbi:hypothetical protein GWI33_004366 [Rhynchophorus ferrugineus]|uniref:Major facilitator superfamily (MFS) profile domain-containing protein n=1 Tax=Rhynchophorus ferrugineus TaxID=354439 RepID=A0A834IX70_RHYFE|nr:hypothetical protein GWI33_004366 [Rhynchophorus ferrugineus]